jgi:hypothetical protein
MGAPTSAITAGTYLQSIEYRQIYNFLTEHKIRGYFTDVKILIIYDESITQISTMMTKFNTIHCAIKFTIENAENKRLNYFDLTIHQKHNKLDFMMYRKHTSTDILIHSTSCHSNEHKLACMTYLMDRLHTYPLAKHAKEAEIDIIQSVLNNNQYKLTHIHKNLEKITYARISKETTIKNRETKNGLHLHTEDAK